jgi:hypothetical protein
VTDVGVAHAWEQVLDALERDLEHHEAVIDGHAEATELAFSAPTDLGPIPAHLAPRAIALGNAFEAAIERAERARSEIQDIMRQLPRPQHHASVPPRHARIDFQS